MRWGFLRWGGGRMGGGWGGGVGSRGGGLWMWMGGGGLLMGCRFWRVDGWTGCLWSMKLQGNGGEGVMCIYFLLPQAKHQLQPKPLFCPRRCP